jgi:hypothetical protein
MRGVSFIASVPRNSIGKEARERQTQIAIRGGQMKLLLFILPFIVLVVGLLVHRYWFWLTVHRRCSWHGGFMHIAPLGWLGGKHNITDGICKTCKGKFLDSIPK